MDKILALAPSPIPNMSGSSITSVSQLIVNVLNGVWIIFGAFAVIMFIVAAIKFLTTEGDMKKAQEARHAFFWGVVGVAVGIVSYTIIEIVGNFIGA